MDFVAYIFLFFLLMVVVAVLLFWLPGYIYRYYRRFKDWPRAKSIPPKSSNRKFGRVIRFVKKERDSSSQD